MRARTAALILIVGLLLVASGLAQYVLARERQRDEQAARDQHWANVQREAALRFPRALPGEEHPAPAPLTGMGWVVGLVGGGAVLSVVGLVAMVRRPREAEKRGSSEAGLPGPPE